MNHSVLVTRNSVKGNYLKNEFHEFGYKVGYLAFGSKVQNNGKLEKPSLNRVFCGIDKKELELHNNGESEDPLLDSYQLERWKKFLGKYYQSTSSGAIALGNEPSHGAKYAKTKIAELFNADRDASILVFMGAADENGDWVIAKENTRETIRAIDVFNAWRNRKSKQKLLLLILDHNYSGKWCKTYNNDLKDETIAIQAACREKEKAYECELGGYLTHNLMKLFQRDQKNIYYIEKQNPIFVGNYLYVKKYTNLFFNYKSWDDMMQISKASYNIAQFENGEYYGYFSNGIRNFWGTMKWNSGPLKGGYYQGEFKNNKLDGKGILHYADGRIHEGDFRNNVLTGNGTEIFPNGDFYKGEFVKGIKTGRGTYTYGNEDKYEGEWLNNLPHGQGVLIKTDGNKYVGEFKSGSCNGKGKIYYYNEDVYEGDWVENEKHGEGTYTTKDGNVYKGEFKNGLRDGYGIMQYNNGALYKGNWKKGVKCGEGVYWNRDGTKTEGEWKNDKMIKEVHFYSKIGSDKIVFK